ncbi:Arc family DNA-binding protein [Klebsiella pneumoniae]|uniref:Arc family DNA-binding protein n=1 Tax=Klebsiella pneumoniae complex TaxID=3390273 RepID=UPI000DE64E91|nr:MULTISPECIES: Arc family DNA-binding protein [Klebsiella]MDZ0185374.1 Arc family DNA-binding protein [Klebsiella quasipneumoniae]SSG63140.1 Arc-like DNA binding domain protein [Klebsiella pneumoniae]HBT0596793.1 Arc family DNA-binding protein [Klebsiella pneumoniae]HBX6129366.1 Arc family DNA-binding protein [Klebsiella pneumoniae]HDG7583823.1 Arc family DNA-binding protein [Klebsiella pneumoniae]
MKGASLIAPFGLRMPEELKEKIAERAKSNGRSMNAEIVQILEDTVTSEHLLDEFMRDDVKRSGGVQSLSIKELEEIMEKTVKKAFSEFTLYPIDHDGNVDDKKPT